MAIRTQEQFVKFMGADVTRMNNAGSTKEEILSTKGAPDKDPRINPLPELGVVDNIIPNPRKTSDRQRIEEPRLGQTQAAEDQVRLTQFFIRSALKRTRGHINKSLRQGLSSRRDKFGDRAKQMEASFQRLDVMVETLEYYSDMAEQVLSRVLSQQKG